ncbi:MAG: cytochrome b/b6 domain-containing protein [Myxococcota bacterium]|nr:cytochrome b/b6 domain-containing protein [Myxococcota bacterium]
MRPPAPALLPLLAAVVSGPTAASASTVIPHALMLAAGNRRAPVCTDCHGVHDIRRVSDPDSTVVQENLIETCRRCPPGAPPEFVGSRLGHFRPSWDRSPIVYVVEVFYRIAIPGILGGMTLLVLLDARRRLCDRRARARHGGRTDARQREFRRFTGGDMVEHWLMAVFFTVLAITGLPQMSAGRPVAEWAIGFLGGLEMVRILHHLFGVLLTLLMIFHVVRVGYKVIVLRAPLSMLPRLSDVRVFAAWLRWALGRSDMRPAIGRYGFEHKVEYWALIWGTVLMIATGFVLLVPIRATSVLPGEIIPAAKAAHGYEAVLAVLAVIIWHAYNVHVRHWNRSMFTGKLTEHEMREEHPAELQRLQAESGGEEGERGMDRNFTRRRKLYLSFATVFVVASVAGMKVLLIEETPSRTPPTLEGRGDCLMCHRAGGVEPIPADHAGRANATCVGCHPAGGA